VFDLEYEPVTVVNFAAIDDYYTPQPAVTATVSVNIASALPIPLVVCQAHHWLIAEPDGPMSLGRCTRCGATKEFHNWNTDLDHFDGNSMYRQRGAFVTGATDRSNLYDDDGVDNM